MTFADFLLAKHQPLMDLCWHLAMYASVTLLHTRTSAPAYKRAFRKSSNLPLAIHIISGLSEVFRYQFRQVFSSQPVTPNAVDLALALAHSWSVLVLSKTLLRGCKTVTRPSYQAGAVLRVVASVAAFAMGSAELHHGSVRIINGFIYTRAIIFVIWRLDLMRSYAATYATAVFLAGCLATYESAIPVAMPLYIAFVLGVLVLNRWVSAEVAAKNIQVQERYGILSQESFVLLLARAGFAELDTIRRLENPDALSPEIKDDYVKDESASSAASDSSISSNASVTAKVRRMKSGMMRSRRLNKAVTGQSQVEPRQLGDCTAVIQPDRRHSLPVALSEHTEWNLILTS